MSTKSDEFVDTFVKGSGSSNQKITVQSSLIENRYSSLFTASVLLMSFAAVSFIFGLFALVKLSKDDSAVLGVSICYSTWLTTVVLYAFSKTIKLLFDVRQAQESILSKLKKLE